MHYQARKVSRRLQRIAKDAAVTKLAQQKTTKMMGQRGIDLMRRSK
jgi:hypothetical protein